MAPGYEEFNNDGVPMVMRLFKSIYGLRQSPRCWYGTVDEYMVVIGPKSLKADLCVYIYSEGGAIFVLTLYVDGILLLGKDRKVLERIKWKLIGRYLMTDMGDVSLVLGMEVTRDRTKGTVSITHATFPGYHEQGNVPRTGDSLQHQVYRQSASAGDFQTF